VEDGQDAGAFSPWLAEIRGAIAGANGADVPCHGCTACCRSSQFVPIGPDETATLARIPPDLLFPAPLRPGHFVLGYDERGHCPMLVDNRCSIYEDRPQTCRTYDCRVFSASGIEIDNAIGRQAQRWRFTFPAADDRRRLEAVRAAAAAIAAAGVANATEQAVRAIEIHESFLPLVAESGTD
jgi:Fe-S-cluster containining protein